MKRITFLLLILFTISCKDVEKKEREITSIQATMLQATSLKNVDYSYLVESLDDYIIVLNARTGHVISMYDWKDLSFITSGIEFGTGPEEMLSPVFLQVDEQDKSFYVYDPSQRKIIFYDFYDALENKILSPKTIAKTPATGDFMFPVFHLKNQEMLAMTYTQDSHLLTFTKDGEEISRIGSFPSLESKQDILPQLEGMAWEGRYAYSQSKNLLIKGYFDLDRLDILDTEGMVIHTGTYSDLTTPEFVFDERSGRMNKKSNRKICYVSMKSTDNSIFGLYSGKNFNEISDVLVGDEIHVFDYEATMIAKIKLPIAVSDFVIDERSKTIVGVNYTLDEGLIKFTY